MGEGAPQGRMRVVAHMGDREAANSAFDTLRVSNLISQQS